MKQMSIPAPVKLLQSVFITWRPTAPWKVQNSDQIYCRQTLIMILQLKTDVMTF